MSFNDGNDFDIVAEPLVSRSVSDSRMGGSSLEAKGVWLGDRGGHAPRQTCRS